MNIWNRLNKIANRKKRSNSAPLIILQKDSDGTETVKYDSIEKAIADLENDTDITKEKLELLRLSLDNLKHKNSIKIKNGEIID